MIQLTNIQFYQQDHQTSPSITKRSIGKTSKFLNETPKLNRLMQGISWYHIAHQVAYTSIASSTDDTRGEATSTVPESQSTLQTRYIIIQQEIARL